MYAKVEDLRKGDIVIIGNSAGIFDVKLLRQPQQAKTGKKTTWGGATRWTTVVCALREETITQYYTNYQGNTVPYVHKRKVLSNGKEYNIEKRIDFSEKECWIVKRDTL